jgi:chromosome segregation protein
MRLERLEIAGFKSFSDRSELSFDRGVTAIVGPNGCGKSNVADAITWVLGEQSARSLRGETMEDVIFSGSDARKPTGTAEVRLRLSGVTTLPSGTVTTELAKTNGHGNGNGSGYDRATDASPIEDVLEEFRPAGRDVELIRRLYRSGESEYLIDGEHCRLKDIHELLMDTGLGAKAYAIIEQGKIGLILSSRPTDRRQLIEEAAGITKYKARRRSAELKLEAAQQNLTRVDDIVFEVEKQRGSLKRQAAKARRHQRLRDELRRWEKVLFARKYRELAQSIDSARRKLSDVREREAIAAAAVAENESTLSALRIEVAEHDARVTTARERAHAHELEIRRTEQQVELNRQQIDVLGTRMTELAQELDALGSRREPQRLELEQRRDRAARAEQEQIDAESRLASENEAYALAAREIEGLERDVEAARRDVFGAISHAATLRHAIDNAAAAGERVRDDLSRLDVEETDLRVESERLTESRVDAERALAAAQASLERARGERSQLDIELSAGRADHARLAQELRTREHDLAGLVARLASLEELEAARAGFTEGARIVLAEANGSVDQHGAVADWLEVDRRYERPVEALLGDLLQHVVVPTYQHATSGLELLRARDAGRCGFVVVGEQAVERERLPAVDGAIALDTVVQATGPYAAAVRAVLPRAYVAESLEVAIAAAHLTGAEAATPDGDIVRGRHVVVGGSRHDARGILATKNEIRELRARVDEGRDGVAAVAASLAGAGDRVSETTAAIEKRSAELHELEKDIVGFEAQMARLVDEATRLGRKGELLTSERRRADEEAARHDARRAEAQQSITELEARQRELEATFTAAQQRLSDARGRVESLAARVAEAKAAHAALVERRTALAAEVVRLQDASREMEMRLAALAAERAQKSDRRAALEVETAEALARFDAAVIELDTIKSDVHAAESAAGTLRGRVEGEERSVRDARANLDSVRAAASELEIARATADSDLTHLGSTCLETVQSTLEDVIAEVDELERAGAATPDTSALSVDDGIEDEERAAGDAPDVDPFGRPVDVDSMSPFAADGLDGAAMRVEAVRTLTAEEAIVGLRAKIDRLGAVNMMAIEQYDELEVRHQFLTTQRKDLVDSIAATNEAITRIDETSTVRFREAFEAINRNFQQTFSTLFGGGHAGITLIDQTDPLESGIDIVASPPGKRLQNVQLLSGGEKALTAIALMFAIFKYKPSPFCLLDEIDAPLDDANIGRFVEMLKGLLHHTQFILITHNRKTMEIADRLYGVTMEEPGVSKLISVRLN